MFLAAPDYTGSFSFSVQQLDQAKNARGHVVIQDRPARSPHDNIIADLSYLKLEGDMVRAAGVITRSTTELGCLPGEGFLIIARPGTPYDQMGWGCSPDPATAIVVVERSDHLWDPPWLAVTHGNVKVS